MKKKAEQIDPIQSKANKRNTITMIRWNDKAELPDSLPWKANTNNQSRMKKNKKTRKETKECKKD